MKCSGPITVKILDLALSSISL